MQRLFTDGIGERVGVVKFHVETELLAGWSKKNVLRRSAKGHSAEA
jgi:hypothetical protein